MAGTGAKRYLELLEEQKDVERKKRKIRDEMRKYEKEDEMKREEENKKRREEYLERLKKEEEDIQRILQDYKSKSVESIWIEELDEFVKAYNVWMKELDDIRLKEEKLCDKKSTDKLKKKVKKTK